MPEEPVITETPVTPQEIQIKEAPVKPQPIQIKEPQMENLSAADVAAVTRNNCRHDDLNDNILERAALNSGKLDGIQRELAHHVQDRIMNKIDRNEDHTTYQINKTENYLKNGQDHILHHLFTAEKDNLRERIECMREENRSLRNELSQERQTLTILRAVGVIPPTVDVDGMFGKSK